MDQVITTVMFDGRFWIALIEKCSEDGKKFIGKYTFGPEPTNPDLLRFYLCIVWRVPVYESDMPVRIRKPKSFKKEERGTSKSFMEFKRLQKEAFGEKKRIRKRLSQAEKEEKYLRKREMKKHRT